MLDHVIPYPRPVSITDACSGGRVRWQRGITHSGVLAVTLFLSTYINKVDRKGRVSVPAQYRLALADQNFCGIIAFPSLRESYDAIEGCGINRMEELSKGVDALNPFSDENDVFSSAIFGSAFQLAFDGEGRIVLPDSLRGHACINEQAAFIGRGKTFQIWEPSALKIFQEEARRRVRGNRSGLSISSATGLKND